MFSLRTRLSASYILVALLSIIIISALVNFFLEKQFRQYVKDNMEQQNKQIVSLISQQYHGGGTWNQSDIAEIGMNALSQGLIIKLTNPEGKIVWNAMTHNNGLCQQMLAHMAQNMASRYPKWKGNYAVNRYPVLKNLRKIGSVEIGYYGPFYLKDTDLAFINTLNRLLMGVTILAIFIALFIGNYMAKRLSNPIAKVINSATAIANGKLEIENLTKTNINEINQLNEAVKNLAQTLQQQEILRKRLTADVAHELRTPLATVQSHLEAMIDGIWQLEVSRLKSCHEEITRINRMVFDLEKLAKFEGENLKLHKTRFDVTELLAQIVLNFESEFRQKDVKIEFRNETAQIIEADRDKISQVIVNLLSNGLKYTPAGGTVAVSLRTLQDGIEILIKDNGVGISTDDLPYIWERFYRADKSRNRLTGGSGIGLSIVKAIIDAHKGRVNVHSEVGRETEFRIFLPSNTL